MRFFRWNVVRWVLAVLGVVFVGLQFFPAARTNPPVTAEVPAPEEVRAVLRRACYDCHSNETVWPWYAKVAPVSWLVSHDVEEGRSELNFSTWGDYDAQRQARKQEECWDEVDEGKMPLWYYTPLHGAAKLSAEDRELLRGWATGKPADADGAGDE